MGAADKPWHFDPTTHGGLFQAPSSVASCQVHPDISQLCVRVVWICFVRILELEDDGLVSILLELLRDFVCSPPKVKALQMGVWLCEAARADPCLGVWQGWPTDHLLDGLDEGR